MDFKELQMSFTKEGRIDKLIWLWCSITL
jgi:hypothetical protein